MLAPFVIVSKREKTWVNPASCEFLVGSRLEIETLCEASLLFREEALILTKPIKAIAGFDRRSGHYAQPGGK
jgi:hypothetical protein